MCESSIAHNLEDKMGETASSNPVLEVSVSFGRFANDSLSWEKWSSFSPNKYMEEVEKCATPGSVAKKAAYFEAHYKKIAARKAELLNQEKKMDHQHQGDLITENCRNDSEFDVDESQSPRGVVIVNQENSMVCEESGALGDKPNGDVASSKVCQRSSIEGIRAAESRSEVHKLDMVCEESGALGDKANGDVASNEVCQSSSIEGIRAEESRSEVHKLDRQEEAEKVLVKEEEENASKGMKDVLDLQGKEIKDTQKGEEETVKLNRSKDSHKITPVNKDKNTSRIKKKPASSVSKAAPVSKVSPMSKASPTTKSSLTTKAPQISTPKVSKPTSMPTSVSSTRSSTKTTNSSIQRSKNVSALESKKVPPKSLHMSLSYGPSSCPSSSDPNSLTTRRQSLIMERMGDKDIVKRAFKTFQNNYNQSRNSCEDPSPASNKVAVKGTEPMVSTTKTPQKENGGSFKATSVEKKYAKAAPSSFALKSNEKLEKRREVPKKGDNKSSARDAERRHINTKPKEDKEAEIKKLRQNRDIKSTSLSSMPVIYRGQKITKGSVDKGNSKNRING